MAQWKLAAATAAFALASPATGQPSAPAAAPETVAPTAEDIALVRDRFERLTVPVTIAGQGPWRFFIDTGAQATVISRRIAVALNLAPTGTALLVALASSRRVDTVELDDVSFANHTISGLTSPLLDATHIGGDGILGLDLLQTMRVLIDFKTQRMQVAEAQALVGNRGYEIVVTARRRLGQMIITDARVDGVKTTVLIDTGAQNSIGNPVLFARLRARAGENIVSTDVHGIELRSRKSVIDRMIIGKMELRTLDIGFTDSPVFAALGLDRQPALILGMGNLRMFDRVAIDFANRKVLFDIPAGGRNAPINPVLPTPRVTPT